MSMADRDGVIWYDGGFVPWREATTHVLTHSLHYGMGAIEGIRAYRTARGAAVFRLGEHIDRLFDSAHILGMPMPYEKRAIHEAVSGVIRENGLDSAYIRPICFYGAEGMGLRADNLKVHVVVAAWSWEAYLGEAAAANGIRARTVSFNRHHVNVSMCRAKASGHYINSMLALNEARACGADEALLLDTAGYVSEGSSENIFIVRDGGLITPELTSALAGVTRDTVLQLARGLGISPVVRRMTRDEIYVADEAFFTGTAAELAPIRELDGRVIGAGRRGPITEKLQSAYCDAVHGRRSAHPEWLTFVERPRRAVTCSKQ